jgi:DNA-binding beta-propeller fold protein YncE
MRFLPRDGSCCREQRKPFQQFALPGSILRTTAGISALRENVILDNAVLNLYYGAKSNAFKEGGKMVRSTVIPIRMTSLLVVLTVVAVAFPALPQGKSAQEASRPLPAGRDQREWVFEDRLFVESPSDSEGEVFQAQEGVRSVAFPTGFAPTLSNNVVYSGDGRVGFVASYSNSRLFSFDTRTGEMLGEVVVCCGPGGITLHERPEKRVVLVKNFDTDDVAIVDATDPRAMRIQARFTPPAGTDFYYAIGRPAISSDGRIGFIGSERGTDKLYIFDVETGELLSSVTVSGRSPITWSLVPGKPWIAVVVDEGGYITMVNATNPRSPSIVWSRSYTFDGWSDFASNNIVFNSSGTIGYVAHWGNTVFSFDVNTGSVISSLYLGSGRRPRVLAFNELTGTLIVANEASNTVSILRTTSGGSLSLQATFTPNADLDFINNPALSADGTIGFVASPETNKLYVFRTSDGREMASVPMQGRSYTVETFRIPGKRLVSVVNTDFSPSVTMIDYTDLSKVEKAGEFRPHGASFSVANNIVYSRDGRTIFVASAFTDLLYAVNAETGEILDALVPGDGPRWVSLFDQGGTRFLIVVNEREDTLAVVDATDPADLKLVRRIRPPSGTDFTAWTNAIISPDGQYVFVADYGDDRVFSFDVLSGTLVSGTLVGKDPVTIAFSAATRRLATVNVGDTSVSLLEVDTYGGLTRRVTFTLPSGSSFESWSNVVFSLRGDVVYVPSSANRMLYAFDADGGLISSRRLADKPWRVTVSPDGRFLLASLEKSLALLEVSAVGDLLLRATLSDEAGDRYYYYYGALFSTDGNQIFVASNKWEEYRGITLLRDGVITTYDLEGKRLAQVSTGGAAVGLVRSSQGQLSVIAGDNRLVVLTPRA